MANNRIYLCCLICVAKEETAFEDCFYYCMKYYPAQGWYTTRDRDEIDGFLDKHKHGTLLGEYILLFPESRMPGYGEDKAQILETITKSFREMQDSDDPK